VTELERRLVALGEVVVYPPTPDLAARVRATLDTGAPQRRRAPRLPWGLAPRHALVAALAFLVVATGVTMAVSPSARSAILRWLGIGGVRVTRVEELPPTRAGADLSLGERVTLAQARRRAGFPVVIPGALGSPDEVHFSRDFPRGVVSLVYRPRPGLPRPGPSGVSVLLTEFSGSVGEYVQKMAGPGIRIRRVAVRGEPGLLITGPLHAVIFEDARGDVRQDRPRLASNTLLWERGTVSLRLEADLGPRRLLEIARSVR
jgi:hypothetical protein